MNCQNQQPHLAFNVVDDPFHRAGAIDYQRNVETAFPQATDEPAKASANSAAITRADSTAAPDSDTAARHRSHVVRCLTDRLGAVLGDNRPFNRHWHSHFRHRHFGDFKLLQLLSTATAAG